MLVKRMGSIHKQGKMALADYKAAHEARTDRLVTTLRDVVRAYQTSGDDAQRLAAITATTGS
jgi:hypothetical protein